MKKFIVAAAALLCGAAAMNADNGQSGALVYSLPQTVVTVEVTAVKEVFQAGPYAAYGRQLLGQEFPLDDAVNTKITEMTLYTRVEGDMASRFSISGSDAAKGLLTLSSQGLVSLGSSVSEDEVRWRFTSPIATEGFEGKGLTSGMKKEVTVTYKEVLVDSVYRKQPVTQEKMVVKTLEMKAKEAAEMILLARSQRLKIATGDTDATFSGEALGSALSELTRIEQEYLSLFCGIRTVQVQTMSFDIIPEKGVNSYPLFRISEVDGLVPAKGYTGLLYSVKLDVEPILEAEAPDEPVVLKKGMELLYYRTPAICKLTLGDGRDAAIITRIPVYQLGVVNTIPVRK